jgi:hypothetical protein
VGSGLPLVDDLQFECPYGSGVVYRRGRMV